MPREKRHIKATYANATPATDGRYVVAFFGSQGLYAFDMKGKLVWKKDLGVLNTGAYDLPEYEWGTASSPIIYKDLVIVQCDTQNESFVLAADIRTGEDGVEDGARGAAVVGHADDVCRRRAAAPPELVTNASNFIRGYDPDTGKELWRLGGSSKITAPTPVFSRDLIVVASGRRAGAADLRDPPGRARRSHAQGGGAVERPRRLAEDRPRIVHADAADLRRRRSTCSPTRACSTPTRSRPAPRSTASGCPHQGSGFSASPVAADGRLYLSSEDGDIFVVNAGADVRDHRPVHDGRAADGHAGDRHRHHVRARRAASVRDRQDRQGSEVSFARAST